MCFISTDVFELNSANCCKFVPFADAILCCRLFLSTCHHGSSQLDSRERRQHFIVVRLFQQPGFDTLLSVSDKMCIRACSNPESNFKSTQLAQKWKKGSSLEKEYS